MSDDWNDILQVSEEFDPTWPYNFKWAFDSQTGRADVWRVKGGTDGRPTHRAEVRERWGRDPKVSQGDLLGLATYIPAEMKIDGTVVAPPEVHTQTYYNQPTPQEISQWFQREFPHAMVRDAVIAAPRLARTAETMPPPVFKWIWNERDGFLMWQVEGEEGKPFHDEKAHAEWGRRTSPHSEGDVLGYALPDTPQPGKLTIETYNYQPIPPRAFAAAKQQIVEWYPNYQILGDVQKADAFNSDPTDYRSAALAWAHANLGSPSEDRSPQDSAQRDSNAPVWPWRGLARLFSKSAVWEKTAEADMEGCMVALFVPEEAAKKLKIRGGEPVENMHITLLYFSDKAADRDDWDEVEKLIEQIANQTPPMSGTVSGYGVFNSDEGDVLWASPSIQGLAELRHKIYEACEDAGFHTDSEHDWVPHITLKYKHRGKLPKVTDVSLDFSELSFAQGGNKTHYDLKGHLEKTTALPNRKPGQRLYFEYHCYEGDDSNDAHLWYRSHQPVTVVSPGEDSWGDRAGEEVPEGWNSDTRAEFGAPRTYQVRFDDGYKDQVFEDELVDSPNAYYRPDPPKVDDLARLQRQGKTSSDDYLDWGSAKVSAMGFSGALETLSQLREQGVLPDFCLIGSVAASNYIEAAQTFDIDVVVLVSSDDELRQVWQRLVDAGGVWQGDAIELAGVKIQIWPSTTKPLWAAALSSARMTDAGVKVADPEHLVLLALDANRAKDRVRAAELLQVCDVQRLTQLAASFNLQEQLASFLALTGRKLESSFESVRTKHRTAQKLSLSEKLKVHDKLAADDYLDWSGWEGAHQFITDGKELLTAPSVEQIDPTKTGLHEGLTKNFREMYPDAKSFVGGWTVPTADGMGLGIWAPAAGHGDKHEPGLHEIIAIIEKEFGKPAHLITNGDHLSDEGMYDPGIETEWQTISRTLTKPN